MPPKGSTGKARPFTPPPVRRNASPAPGKGKGVQKGKGKRYDDDDDDEDDRVGRKGKGGRPSSAGPKGRARSASPATATQERRQAGRSPARTSRPNGRSSSAPPVGRADGKKAYLNPDGTALEDLEEGAEVEAIVTNTGNYGVFVDIGAERNARLNMRLREQRRFKRGDKVTVTIESVDTDTNKVSVTIEDIDEEIEPNRRPLEDFEEGDVLDGVVVDKNQYGTWINIGCIKDGRLNVTTRVGRTFVRGQVVRDLVIDTIDLEKQWIQLSVDDPEAAAADLTIVSLEAMQGKARKTGKGKGKAKAKAKAKSVAEKKETAPARSEKANGKPEVQYTGPPVGSYVDGMVTSITARGVTVSLEDGMTGSLQVSAELQEQFQKGDRVQGMKVEKVGQNGMPILSMEDPELEVLEEPKAAKAPRAGKGKGKGKKA